MMSVANVRYNMRGDEYYQNFHKLNFARYDQASLEYVELIWSYKYILSRRRLNQTVSFIVLIIQLETRDPVRLQLDIKNFIRDDCCTYKSRNERGFKHI